MRLREEKGFTLIEVIVVAAIIAVLAGIIVPLVFKEVDEAKISKAKADVKTIQTAIMMFYKDTKKWPWYVNEGGELKDSVTVLISDGNLPANFQDNCDTRTQSNIREHLVQNSIGYNDWKGPYLSDITTDPWGNAYVVNAVYFGTQNPVWILSAGPDGRLDTSRDSQTLAGDDIGIRLQ